MRISKINLNKKNEKKETTPANLFNSKKNEEMAIKWRW